MGLHVLVYGAAVSSAGVAATVTGRGIKCNVFQ
jgi:hypothetical protein